MKKNIKNDSEMILRDKLAVERTKLAVERTFLAYFRSSIVFFASGISILKIHFFKQIDYLGYILIIISPIIFFIGLYSNIRANKSISIFKETTKIK